MIRIKPVLKHWESLSSQQVYKDPKTFSKPKKRKPKPPKDSFKSLKKKIKILQEKIFILDDKNQDLRHTLKCKDEELQRVREELKNLKENSLG